MLISNKSLYSRYQYYGPNLLDPLYKVLAASEVFGQNYKRII